MKKTLLIYLLLFALSANSQIINFEQVFPSPPLPQKVNGIEKLKNIAVAFSDIDLDNDIDLLITGVSEITNNNETKLYENDGFGQFEEILNTGLEDVSGGYVRFVDIDNDMDEDLFIVPNYGYRRFYLNDGDGNFSESTNALVDRLDARYSVAFADIDNDGDNDGFAFREYGTELFLNDGDGNFTRDYRSSFEGVSEASSAFSDIDGDNDIDFILTGYSRDAQGPATRLYINQGDGSFLLNNSTPFEDLAYAAIGFDDIDGDSDPDLFISGYISSYVYVSKLYVNDGVGNFNESNNNSFLPVKSGAVAFGDYDNDDDNDIILSGEYRGSSETSYITKIYNNNGSGEYTEETNFSFTGVVNGTNAFLDFDNDLDLDLFISGQKLSSTKCIVSFYENDASGDFHEINASVLEGIGYSCIITDDIDGDGDKDILMSGQNNDYHNVISLYRNNNGQFIKEDQTPFESLSESEMCFADINGDSAPDVIISGMRDDDVRITKIYTNDSDGGYSEATYNRIEGLSKAAIAFGDIDGDNDLDLLISGETNDLYYNQTKKFEKVFKVYLNDGNGKFTEDTEQSKSGAINGSIAVADIDGDNDLDIIINGYWGMWVDKYTKLYKNDGTGNFEYTACSLENIGYGKILFSDLDGDNDEDIILSGNFNKSLNGNSKTSLYYNDGSGNFSEDTNVNFKPLDQSDIVISDLDGDNDDDIIITGYNNSFFTMIYQNNGNGQFLEVENLPFEGVVYGSIATLDIDNDRKTDVIISGLAASGYRTYLYKNMAEVSTNTLELEDKEDSFSIYPNPTQGRLDISIDNGNNGRNTIEIYDLSGKLLFKQLFETNEFSIDVSGYNKGFYIVKVLSNNKQRSEKLIIE